MTGLRLSGLTKRYGPGPAAVDGMSLEVAAGEFLALLGPSGCGKTTCLRMLAGLVPPDEGRIEVGGRDVTALPPFRRNMGLVFQNYALFPHMDVAANVAFGLEMRSVSSAERARLVAEALRLVRLEGYELARPAASSSASRWRARWSSARTCSCSTSPCPTSTPSCASRCGWRSARSSARSRSPPSS